MMEIKRLTKEYLNEVHELALMNYEEERIINQDLPEISKVAELEYFCEHERGFVAIEKEKVIAYMAYYGPFEGLFDTYDSLCIFVPINGHGAIKENRADIYQRIYQVLAEDLYAKNVVVNGISVYEHDDECKRAFFDYGFGKRCVDEICVIDDVDIKNKDLSFRELDVSQFPGIRNLRIELNDHLKKSPCFMQGTDEDMNRWLERVEKGDRRTFVCLKDDKILAYLDVAEDGENFLTWRKDMLNIQGAYCIPSYRGQGIMDDLLAYVKKVLKNEGIVYLGVDHESYNPTAAHYWKKHFKPYTASLIRYLFKW